MEVTKHEPGMFSWADLASTDEKGSRRFYTELLGLNATAFPIGGGAEYVALSKNGKSVCAMYEMSEEVRQQTGGRPFWNAYFTVESADDTAAEAKRRGGAALQEPFDVMGEGRMAVLQDPTGAVFSVWEPKSGIGAQVFGEPGALAWSELYTHNTEAASDFYAGLFGWSVNRTRGANNDEYFEFQIDGRSAAGMMAIKEEWGEMPPPLVDLLCRRRPGRLYRQGEGPGRPRGDAAHGGPGRGPPGLPTGPSRGVLRDDSDRQTSCVI